MSQIFSGLSFFLLQRVPSRVSYVADIRKHGGVVVMLESQADIIIADHMRRDAPAGAISYTFLDHAIKHGELPDKAAHMAAKPHTSAGMPTGSAGLPPSMRTSAPVRGHRTPYTHDDDVLLYKWVMKFQTRWSAHGLAIYKELEKVVRLLFEPYAQMNPWQYTDAMQNPRHTYQSYLDRYRKFLDGRPPAGINLDDLTSDPRLKTPPEAGKAARMTALKSKAIPDTRPVVSSRQVPRQATSNDDELPAGYNLRDYTLMMCFAKEIREVPMKHVRAAWDKFQRTHTWHTSNEWQSFYWDYVDAKYEAACADEDVDFDTRQIDEPVKANEVKTKKTDKDQSRSRARTAPRKRATSPEVSGSVSAQEDEEAEEILSAARETKRRRLEFPTGHLHASRPESRAGTDKSAQKRESPHRKVALTAENLAAIADSSETGAVVGRAYDLPLDADPQGQPAFAEYLQNVVRGVMPSTENISRVARTPQISKPHSIAQSSDTVDNFTPRHALNYVAHEERLEAQMDDAQLPDWASEEDIVAKSVHVDSDVELSHASHPAARLRPDAFDENESVKAVARPEPRIPSSHRLSRSALPSREDLLHRRQADTQAIYDADTQALDLGMPEIPQFSSESGSVAGDFDALDEDAMDDAELQTYIVIKTADGCDERMIVRALERTSMRKSLADMVLDALLTGEDVPQGCQGIWSEQDDQDLQGSNSRILQRLDKIHSAGEVRARMAWLAEYKWMHT